MRALLWLASLGVVGWAMLPETPSVKVYLTGDYRGQLTPCGCTRPMSGGIRRMATVARAGELVDTGGWVTGTTRQDTLKAETLADTLGRARVQAAFLTSTEAALGEATVTNLETLMGAPWVRPGRPVETEALWIGGSPDPRAESDELERWLRDRPAHKATLWMTTRRVEQAKELARPGLDVVAFRSDGSPDLAPVRVGETWLVSTGPKGKMVVELTLTGGHPSAYRRVELDEHIHDDPQAARAFSTYLDRVGEAGLLSEFPRTAGPKFAGTKACGSCHSSALASWSRSAHARALQTLERENTDRDPDCLPCHVVGLSSTRGFVSRAATPRLSDVGCESCHGPGRAHSLSPKKVTPPKVGLSVCGSCHNADHSPGFDAAAAWPAISHPSVEKTPRRSRRSGNTAHLASVTQKN